MRKRECLIVAGAAILAGCGVAAEPTAPGGAPPRYGVLNWCGDCGPIVPARPIAPPVEPPPEDAVPAPIEAPSPMPPEEPTPAPVETPSPRPEPTPAPIDTPSAPPVEGPSPSPAPTPCAAPSTAPAEAVTIVVRDFAFEPATVTIAPGTAVTWKFEGPSPHTATASLGAALRWNSGIRRAGDTFTHRFERAGAYDYHCDLHPRMQGRVTVATPD